MKIILLLLIFALVVSCDSEEQLKEQEQIKTQESINAQNKNLEFWSSKLSTDLDRRRAFIKAVEGEYTGTAQFDGTKFITRMLISPTLPDYDIDRVKTLNELEYEMQNLNLNIEIVRWSEDRLFTGGCIFENIRPDLKKGLLYLLDEECPITYQIYLSPNSSKGNIRAVSSQSAGRIKNGSLNKVSRLYLKQRSTKNPSVRQYFVKRIQE